MVTRTVRLRASSASRMALSRSLSCALSCTAMPTVMFSNLRRASLCTCGFYIGLSCRCQHCASAAIRA